MCPRPAFLDHSPTAPRRWSLLGHLVHPKNTSIRHCHSSFSRNLRIQSPIYGKRLSTNASIGNARAIYVLACPGAFFARALPIETCGFTGPTPICRDDPHSVTTGYGEAAGSNEKYQQRQLWLSSPRHFLRPRSDLGGIQNGVYFQPTDAKDRNSDLRRDPWIRKNLIGGDS